MKRRQFIRSGLAFGAGVLLGPLTGYGKVLSRSPLKPPGGLAETVSSTDEGFRAPNIVYIFSDQHRGDCLGALGHPVLKTPNLNNLATEGVVFGRCYTNAPLCRPARTTMMTGLYPREHGVWDNFSAPNWRIPNHVRRLRDEAGYHTAVVGKTHLHLGEGHLGWHSWILEQMGFDSVHELPGPRHTRILRSEYSDWLSLSTLPGQRDKYERLRDYLGQCRNHFWDRPWDTPPLDDPQVGLSASDHMDIYTGRAAAAWIRDYAGAQPFYLQVNFPGPHNPNDAPMRYRQLYDPDDPHLPPGILVQPPKSGSRLVKISRKKQNVRNMTPQQHRLWQTSYFAKVSLIDDAVGRVLEALAEQDLLDNTWIIYGSDHGEMLGDHYLAQKGLFYESSVRVPLIIRPAGGIAGRRCNGLVDQLDVTATIQEIAGLENESDHGKSLVFESSSEPLDLDLQAGKDFVVSETWGYGMIFDGRFKLVLSAASGKPVELYDLEEDPQEVVNRVRDQAFKRIKRDLRLLYQNEATPANQSAKKNDVLYTRKT